MTAVNENSLFLFFAAIATVLALLLWRRKSAASTTRATIAPIASDEPFDTAPVAMFQLRGDYSIVRANSAFQLMLGLGADVPPLFDLVHPEDADAVATLLRQLRDGYGDSVICEARLRHGSGYMRWVQLHIGPAPGSMFLIVAIDIAERKRAEQLFRSEEEKLKALIEQLPMAVWMLSSSRSLMFVNGAVETLFGCSKESVYADPLSLEKLIHPGDSERVLRMRQHGARGSYVVSYRLLRDDGEIRHVREQAESLFDERGRQLYLICSATDISGEMFARDELHALNSRLREANLKLRENARMDAMTGCLNRAALIDEAEKALQLEHRYRRSSALVFFDLNDFKGVNDNFGHHIGDRCLIAFAAQIKARLRTTDELGRYGGDEFVALLRETDALQAQQLLTTLAPIVIDDGHGSSIILRYSAGIADSGDAQVRNVDDWLRIADQQMYTQKQRCIPHHAR